MTKTAKILMVLCLLTSFGCAQLPQDPYWTAELGWQAGHVVDVLQTINGPGRNGDCFEEADRFTKQLIGKNPSTGEVLAWGVGSGLLHYGVSKWLDNIDAKPWVKGTWQAVTIVYKADAVIENHRVGVRPWGNNVGCQ